ncbi:MAG: hypothetical protein JXD23_06300 [Spirochaetales bacterium]|nr:hypothetical protein [Spirochaetales bacterium]
MRKIIIFVFITAWAALAQGCGNLLEEPGREPTLEQKMRGVWMVGGLSANNIFVPVAQVDLYDPVRNVWYPAVTSLPTPVSFAGTASCNGKIFVAGGFDNAGNPTQLLQIYDAALNTWTYGATLTGTGVTERANIDLVAAGDYLYYAGGTNSIYTSYTVQTNNRVYEYNTLTDGPWNEKIPNPAVGSTSRSNMSLLEFGNVINLLAGRSAVATLPTSANHYGYSIGADGETSLTEVLLNSTLLTRESTAAVVYKPTSGTPKIIMIGGFYPITGTTGSYIFYTSASPNIVGINSVYYLDFPFCSPSVWTPASAYPDNLGAMSAVISGSTIFCFGGASSNTTTLTPQASNGVYALNCEELLTGTWVAQADMPVARFGHTAVMIRQ